MQKPSEMNLLSLKYGYNLYGQFVIYRLDTFSGLVAHDYSSQAKHGVIDTAAWELSALKVVAPISILLPKVNFNEGMFEN
jgi:hypothetical protein